MNIPLSVNEQKSYVIDNKPGKFEILVTPFTPEELLTRRPVTLFQISLDKLGITKQEINYKKTYNSFHHWLNRWRKRNQHLKNSQVRPKAETSLKFKFTDPSTLSANKEPLIKVVK